MAGALLRSGGLKEFFALGAVGNPVYMSATQLRVAIKNQMGADIADVFSIPQRNDRGDTIDWYAPHDGPVVPWSSATPEEQAAAKAYLEEINEKIRASAERFEADADSERQVFGKLLSHAMSFPDDAHVYIVNDKPVLTFWGFRKHDASASTNSLGLLPVAEPKPQAPIPEPAIVDAVYTEVPQKKGRLPWWLWLLLLLLLLLLTLFLLRGCQEEPVPLVPDETVEDPAQKLLSGGEEQDPEVLRERERILREQGHVVNGTNSTRIVDGEQVLGEDGQPLDESLVDEGLIPPELEQPVDDGTLPEGELPPVDEQPPEMPGEEEQPPENPEEQPSEEQPPEGEQPPEEPSQPENPEDPQPEDQPQDGQQDQSEDQQSPEGQNPEQQQPEPPPLNIPQEALKQGKVDFMKGNWSSSTGLIDEKGRPMKLEYQFDDKGDGTVSIKRSDGSVCQGKTSASSESGQLVIKDQGNITCPDGQSYQASKIDCQVGADGKANCKGGYDSGGSFPVDIHQAQ